MPACSFVAKPSCVISYRAGDGICDLYPFRFLLLKEPHPRLYLVLEPITRHETGTLNKHPRMFQLKLGII